MNNKIILGIIIFVVIVVIIYVSTNSSSESYKSKANKCKNVVCSSGKRCINGNCVNYEKYVNEPFEPTELMGNDTTANELTKLRNTKLTKINTNYPDKVILAQNVILINNLPSVNLAGGVKFTGATYGVPRFIYYPMFIFTATKPWVTLNSNGARITIGSGTGSDSCDISIVLVPWGNVNINLPDPLSNGSVTRTVMGITKSVPVVTTVLAETTPPAQLNGRGTSPYCYGFLNKKVKITTGLQYAIAMQATVCTNDFVYMEWDAFSTTTPAVKFLDSICDGVVCSDDTFKCNDIDGMCIKKCEGVVCSPTQKCNDINGLCINCWENKCLNTQDCDYNTGACVDKCSGKCNLFKQNCEPTTGYCVDRCKEVVCSDNDMKCNDINGLCDIKKCDRVVCLNDNEYCEPTTGYCVSKCPENKCDSNTQYCKSTTGECIVSYLIGNDITAIPTLDSLLPIQRNTKLRGVANNYPDKVIIAQKIVSSSSGSVKFVGTTFETPRFIYYPMFIFTAVDQWVTLNSGKARVTIIGGTGNDSADICIVLVQWDETTNLPVPVEISSNVIRTVQTQLKNVPVVTTVLAETTPEQRNGRGTSGPCSGFNNYKVQVPLVIGKTYAIAMQSTICTDDYVYMDWDPFSTTTPAVTFSEF